MATSPTTIIAWTGEDAKHKQVRKAAVMAAAQSQARLIFYDIDGAGERNSAAEGVLSAPELESAGRRRMASEVKRLRDRGIDAYGWLPPSKDAGDLAGYAHAQKADLILLPADMRDPGLLARLKGTPSATEALGAAKMPIGLVENNGDVTYL
jgi:hypothetical protein